MDGAMVVLRDGRPWASSGDETLRLHGDAIRAASALAIALPPDDLLRLSCQALAQELERRIERGCV